MLRLFKYEIPIIGGSVWMPGLKTVLSVGFQGDKLMCWVIAESEAEPEAVSFWVVTTGNEPPSLDVATFAGTAHCIKGGEEFACHVFYRKKHDHLPGPHSPR